MSGVQVSTTMSLDNGVIMMGPTTITDAEIGEEVKSSMIPLTNDPDMGKQIIVADGTSAQKFGEYRNAWMGITGSQGAEPMTPEEVPVRDPRAAPLNSEMTPEEIAKKTDGGKSRKQKKQKSSKKSQMNKRITRKQLKMKMKK